VVTNDALRTGDRRKVIAWAAIVFVIVFAVAFTLILGGPFQRETGAPQPEVTLPRIVVLPFENLGAPDDEYFADGITEEITSRLAAVSGLRVRSRTSAMQYKERRPPLRQIGQELDVGYVLEGTIRWDRGDTGHGRVRITPQLIRVSDDSHMWSERYDRVLEDIFAVQSDIAEQVISQLQANLLERERRAVEARPTDNMEAYNAYLRGLNRLGASLELEDLEAAVLMFERAVELDPDFALGHALACEAHAALYQLRFDVTKERLARAKHAADRALEIDPDLPEGHRAMGFYLYWGNREYDRALAEFERAVQALPNDSRVHAGISWMHRRQGRWTDAVAGLERAIDLDRQNHNIIISLTETFVFLRRYRDAERLADRAIAIAPDNAGAHWYKYLARFYGDGPSARSRRALEAIPSTWMAYENVSYEHELAERNYGAALQWLASFPEPVFEGSDELTPRALGECRCHTFMGEMELAREACEQARLLLEETVRERPEDSRVHAALGLTYALLGRKGEAIREGERAVALWPISKDAMAGTYFLIDLARIYATVGEADAALDRIDELLSIPSELSVSRLRVEPDWDPLRDHPRFQALLEEYEVIQ
jgi:serine/threonine-protein kinase